MKELETWFSGGGLADIGLQAAGLAPVKAVELDPKIAAVYNANFGDHCEVADVREYSLRMGDRVPFWFHSSPPCTNASIAKTDGGEAQLDIEMAEAVVRGIRRGSPWFSLENVWGYRLFKSFQIILKALDEEGYNFSYWHLNSADYGVPQTRKRLILVASKTKRVIRPYATHSKTPSLLAVPWVGWYEAIEHLIPSLPDSEFAPWQLERLPSELKTEWCPQVPQSFLTETKFPNRNAEKSWRDTGTPAPVVTALNPNWRAFFVDSQNTGRTLTVRSVLESAPTITSSCMRRPASAPRAVLMDFKNKHPGDRVTLRDEDEPCFTVTASNRPSHRGKPFLVDGQGNSGGTAVTVVDQEQPAYTVLSSAHKKMGKAWLNGGRVVSMTVQAIACFQSMPRNYKFSGKTSLDCKIVGNGVPCLLMEKLVRSQQLD